MEKITPYSVLDADRVASKLWVGSYPENEQGPAVCQHFNAVVLCAEELQELPFSCSRLHIVKVPIDDAKPSPREIQTAVSAAKTVHALRKKGKRVLVTCAQGVNRSSLVAAMALMLDGDSAKVAIHRIRELRKPPIGLTPLFNSHFTDLLLRLDRQSSKTGHRPISAR